MRAVSQNRRRRQKGSAMLELALSFMAFLLLTMGTMEFGWAVYAYNFCSYSAQDAARWASVRGSLSTLSGAPATQPSILAYVQSQAVGLDPNQLSVTATWDSDNAPGSTVTVTVNYTANPLAGLAIKQPINISSSAQFVVNH